MTGILALVCEAFLHAGLMKYEKEGTKYVRRFLARQERVPQVSGAAVGGGGRVGQRAVTHNANILHHHLILRRAASRTVA